MSIEYKREIIEEIDMEWFCELMSRDVGKQLKGDAKRTDWNLKYGGQNAAGLVFDAMCAATDAINPVYLSAFRDEMIRLLSDADVLSDWIEIGDAAKAAKRG